MKIRPVLTIAKIMHQDEATVEKYACVSSIDEDRESEIDARLFCLGYDLRRSCDHAGRCSDEKEESGNAIRGDKELRQLARERRDRVNERNIDQAIRVLLNDHLRRVIRIPENELGKGVGRDLSTTVCDETIATMPLTEDDIQR